jgi:DNA-binding MarR family transcriptional regulator
VKSVQDEIRQTKPFATREEEAFLALQLTADRLARRSAALMKNYDVSPAQYNTLRILRGAGRAGLACSEIGERMINRDPDITRMLDRLEKRGLVQRCRDQRDRRVITARITKEGVQLLQSMDAPLREFLRKLVSPLGEPKLRSLIRLLDEVRHSAG